MFVYLIFFKIEELLLNVISSGLFIAHARGRQEIKIK
jgi:hypothetical protein